MHVFVLQLYCFSYNNCETFGFTADCTRLMCTVAPSWRSKPGEVVSER